MHTTCIEFPRTLDHVSVLHVQAPRFDKPRDFHRSACSLTQYVPQNRIKSCLRVCGLPLKSLCVDPYLFYHLETKLCSQSSSHYVSRIKDQDLRPVLPLWKTGTRSLNGSITLYSRVPARKLQREFCDERADQTATQLPCTPSAI